MRVLAICVATVGLVAAPAAVSDASGSPARAVSARVTQKAIGAPLPAGARRRQATLGQVACPSPTACVATGAYNTGARNPIGRLFALTRQRGKWTPDVTPTKVAVNVLACPSIGRCVGVSHSVGIPATYVVTQSRRRWHRVVVPLPADLESIACGSAGSCTAVGWDGNRPLLVEERNGAWSPAGEAQLPADAVTAPDPEGLVRAGGVLSVVSCAAAGDCAAAGTYADTVSGPGSPYRSEAWVVTEQAGQWGAGTAVQLPADASLGGDPTKSGTSPFLGFRGLSCPSAGNCTAVGGYEDQTGSEQGLILVERNGIWLQGIRAPLPRGGAAPGEPNAWDDPLFSVSCADAEDCAAIGTWVVPGSVGPGGAPGRYRGWLLTERNGTWSAAGVVLPGKPQAPVDGVYLNSVSCPSRGNCVAVGSYQGQKYGLIVVERHGTWRRGIRAALPADAARRRAASWLDSVSCPSANRCTAVGEYLTRSGEARGLILDLRLG